MLSPPVAFAKLPVSPSAAPSRLGPPFPTAFLLIVARASPLPSAADAPRKLGQAALAVDTFTVRAQEKPCGKGCRFAGNAAVAPNLCNPR